MNWLGRLKKSEIAPGGDATKPTEPGFVGFVAPSHGHIQKIEGADPTPANDAALDPDRDCWPHSAALNGAEIDTFTERLARFTDRGLSLTDAEALADKLVIRDRDGDDRRLCLECLHLKSGAARWGCNQWTRAGLGAAGLPADLVRQLQRCDAFNDIHQGSHDGKTTHA
jgi:hypothetical protein